MPTTLVWTNSAGRSIERSTWDSEAQFTTAVGLVLGQQPVHQCPVADIALDEDVAGMPGHVGQRVEVSGVGQLIEVDQSHGLLGEPLPDEATPDEPGAAGDEDGSH